jgi:hypothetical protein
VWLQEFRAFSHGGKAKVLVLSYPCFRMHKAEVYRMGLDVVSKHAALSFMTSADFAVNESLCLLEQQTNRREQEEVCPATHTFGVLLLCLACLPDHVW